MKRSFERYDILILNELKNGVLKGMIFWYIKMIWKEVLKGYDNLIYWNG